MIRFDNDLCIRCGRCSDNCSVHAIYETEAGLACDEKRCFRCHQCVSVCPVGAVTAEGFEPALEYDRDSFTVEPDKLLNAMRFRRSVRRFTGEKLSREELEMLLTAGRCAPTSSNSQTVRFTVLDREFEELRPRIWASFGALAEKNGWTALSERYQKYLAAPHAPDTLFYGGTQMIAVSSRRPIDGALALANMELLAHTMGLGTLYCGFAVRAITGDEGLMEYFGLNEEGRHLDGCLIVGRTELEFHRTAPRNALKAEWR